MFKKVISFGLCLFFAICAVTVNPMAANAATSSTYIKRYQNNYSNYLKHDKAIAEEFLADYNNSEAQALVARAIWYMENGYMVYGHSKYWDTGYIDCSNFVSLVYKDFGYKITSASRKYNQVGKKVPGVYSRRIKGSSKYELVGTENLRPGDILTFWAKDSDGKGTHIGHVALYMGKINGKPTIIQTKKGRPTAIGITDDFRYWYGKHFAGARRVLDDESQYPDKYWEASDPVIPDRYQLPPQKPVIMPDSKYMSNAGYNSDGKKPDNSGDSNLNNDKIHNDDNNNISKEPGDKESPENSKNYTRRFTSNTYYRFTSVLTQEHYPKSPSFTINL